MKRKISQKLCPKEQKRMILENEDVVLQSKANEIEF